MSAVLNPLQLPRQQQQQQQQQAPAAVVVELQPEPALVEGTVTNASKTCFCIPPIVEGSASVRNGLVALKRTVCCGACGTQSEVVPLRSVQAWETTTVEPTLLSCGASSGLLQLHLRGRTLDQYFKGRGVADSVNVLLRANARADAPPPPHLAHDLSRSVVDGGGGCCGVCCKLEQQRVEVGPQDALQISSSVIRPCRDKTLIVTSTTLGQVDYVHSVEPVGCCAISDEGCELHDSVTIAAGETTRTLHLPVGSAANVQRAITDRARHPATGAAEILVREVQAPTLCCGSMGSLLITNDAVVLRKVAVARGCAALSCLQTEETVRVPLDKVVSLKADDCDGGGCCCGICSRSSRAACRARCCSCRELAVIKARSGPCTDMLAFLVTLGIAAGIAELIATEYIYLSIESECFLIPSEQEGDETEWSPVCLYAGWVGPLADENPDVIMTAAAIFVISTVIIFVAIRFSTSALRSMETCARDDCIKPALSCLSCSSGTLVVIDTGSAEQQTMRLGTGGPAAAFIEETAALIRSVQDQNRAAVAEYEGRRGTAKDAAPTIFVVAGEGLPAAPVFAMPPQPAPSAPDAGSARESRVQGLRGWAKH